MISRGAITAIGIVIIVLVLIFTGACLQGSSNSDVNPPGPTPQSIARTPVPGQ